MQIIDLQKKKINIQITHPIDKMTKRKLREKSIPSGW